MNAPRRLAVTVALGILAVLAGGEWLARRADAAVPPPFAVGADGRVRPSAAWSRLTPFDVAREPSRPRIVWLGASTVAGVPYEGHAAPPAWLAYVLAWRGLDVEVVPLATSALTSTDLANLLPHALELSPTAIVVTTGHNEYHPVARALGAPWWSHLRLLVRARALLGLPTDWPPRLPMHEAELDREALADRFRDNLLAMQAAADAGGVPLLFTAPVSNLRDIPPVLGDDAELPEDADAARARGLERLAAGDPAGARDALLVSRDLDRWPHRATGPLIETLRRTARRLVPVDAAFDAAASDGIPGFELFADYCHPNLAGQRLLAGCVADALEEDGVLPATGRRGELPDLEAGLQHLGVDADLITRTRARLARSYVGLEVLRGRPGHLTTIGRSMLEDLLAQGTQGALRGHVEVSLALADLLEGDAAAARSHVDAARAAAPEALQDLVRLRDRYPWVRRLLEHDDLDLGDAASPD